MDAPLLIWGCLMISVLLGVMAVLTCTPCRCRPRPEPERRAAAALAAHEAQAARAAAILSEQAARLPCFPYAAQGSVTFCAICQEPLRQGQLCSEGPACHHVFHSDCIGAWAKSKGTCPLCRATIVPGSDAVAAADDMV